jgi:NAD-dependent deacetylase
MASGPEQNVGVFEVVTALYDSGFAEIGEVLQERESIVALTGAGISLAAGIPIYRGADGTYLDKENDWWLYREAFDDDPQRWYARFWELHETIRAAQPTRAHHALNALVEAGVVSKIVTQNVDGLNLLAGTDKSRVHEVHGIERQLSCTDLEGCDFVISTEDWLRDHDTETLPTCPHDSRLLKPDVNLRREPGFRTSIAEDGIQGQKALETADAVLVVGTSFNVEPWRRIIKDRHDYGKPVVIVDPNSTTVDKYARFLIRKTADEGLSLLQEQLAPSDAL